MIRRELEDFLKQGWRVEEDPDGIGFYGIGFIEAPSGTCYSSRIFFGELDEGFSEWTEECQNAQDFAHKIIDYINKGGNLEILHNIS